MMKIKIKDIVEISLKRLITEKGGHEGYEDNSLVDWARWKFEAIRNVQAQAPLIHSLSLSVIVARRTIVPSGALCQSFRFSRRIENTPERDSQIARLTIKLASN